MATPPINGTNDSQSTPSRRQILKSMTAMSSAMVLNHIAPKAHAGIAPEALAAESEVTDQAREVFRHSVASGDPLPHGLIIWTRITPTPEALPGSDLGPDTAVHWEIATDPEFSRIIQHGTEIAAATSDHTVKVDVGGLAPATTYFYRFSAKINGQTVTSRVGRTRTAPAAEASLDSLRFGVCSCANYEAGYFQVYRDMARRDDLEFVLHLGDYTYEYEQGGYPGLYQTSVRQVAPQHKTTTLADFRIRQGLYHEDADLAELHASKPMICIWDDHEFADNRWREGATGGSFDENQDFDSLKAAATQAYFEWMPVRRDHDLSSDGLYRTLRYGNLVDLIIPDLRTYRDEQLIQTGDHLLKTNPDFARAAGRDGRTMLGESQLNWFKDSVTGSTTQWQIIANSVLFSPMTIPPGLSPQLQHWLIDTIDLPPDGIGLNMDQWDGYMAERQEIIDVVGDAPGRNIIFLTGDIHSSWASDIPRDVRAYRNGQDMTSIATEFVTPAVTSNGPFATLAAHEALEGTAQAIVEQGANLLRAFNHWFKWIDFRFNGYMSVDINQEGAQCDWHFVDNVLSPDTELWTARSYSVRPGNPRPMPAEKPLDQTQTSF
ncbi:alkaline phosphatase D family protein [Corynebacterium sp. MSK297]|uniref:alkaline phosphatase D family protein n=1 Tax=Corynebacterium sp. MSK297 TaxID=3050221 RepID=UPI00254F2655|nr:alkaline phosphatase D family protein [Corynebacterium sp. MSK297]MDK8845793.1 alkaline phosphatase D family protein [Corynebacterium sp. MSK297]